MNILWPIIRGWYSTTHYIRFTTVQFCSSWKSKFSTCTIRIKSLLITIHNEKQTLLSFSNKFNKKSTEIQYGELGLVGVMNSVQIWHFCTRMERGPHQGQLDFFLLKITLISIYHFTLDFSTTIYKPALKSLKKCSQLHIER